MAATRKDVAKRAGVSSATVSHVISNTKYVSPELRQRVEAAIRELGYKPNIVARSLTTKRTNHVGIIVDNIGNPYYGEIVTGMEEIASRNGYTVSLYSMTGDPDSYTTSAIQRQMDGIFIASSEHLFTREQIQTLVDHDIVLVNSSIPGIGAAVYFDYTPTIDKMIRYLWELGHRKIGFLTGMSMNKPNFMRYAAFRKAMARYGLPIEPGTIIDGEYPYHTDHRDGYRAMKKILSSDTRVTAVFCLNDLMALGAIRAAKDAGLRIPQDISIVGCDDVFFAECIDPPLSTLRVPKKEMGRAAMLQLLGQMRGQKAEIVALDIDLIIRDSTGLAPKQ